MTYYVAPFFDLFCAKSSGVVGESRPTARCPCPCPVPDREWVSGLVCEYEPWCQLSQGRPVIMRRPMLVPARALSMSESKSCEPDADQPLTPTVSFQSLPSA